MSDLAGERHSGQRWLAIDVGGTNMRAAIVSHDGVVGERVDRPTERDASTLITLARDVLEGDRVDGAVVGLPGRIDYGAGRLEYGPNIDPSWRTELSEDRFAEELGVPVALANDADLAAVGEAWFGAGREFRDVAYLTISTGIGAGVVTGGLLVHGRRSVAEVGHTIVDGQRLLEGRKATVEDLGSGTALTELAREAGIAEDAKDLVDLVRSGDVTATRVFERVAFAAALGAVNLAHLFTPDVIVVGGGLGLIGDLILDPIRTLVGERGPRAMPEPISVVNAELGDAAGLAGSAAWHRAFKPQAASRAR